MTAAVEPSPPIRRWVDFAIVAGFGLLTVALGQGNGWDLRNYHLYDGWAFWTQRGAIDFAAAQMQTYFNPLLATFTYLLFTNLPPWLSTFLLGALQGMNYLPVLAIARRLLPNAAARPWQARAIALIGTMGATQLSELGSSIGDNIVSLPVLCAFALLIVPRSLDVRRAMLAGLVAGLTTGIKLTVAPFAIGLTVLVLALHWNRRDRWFAFLATGAAIGCGLLVTDGFWMWRMYQEFGNPLHPMFGRIFGGEFATTTPLRDMRFLPRSILEWLIYPLVWLTTPHRVSDAWFFDLRVPTAFAVLPLLLVRRRSADPQRERALLLALAAAYLIWLALFGVYRYLAPLEMLAPLLVTLALDWSVSPLAITIFAMMLVFVRPPGWGRATIWHEHFVETQVPALPHLDRATIVLAEDEPLAFLALGFPPSAHFIRIAGNTFGPPNAEYGMDREARRRIAMADGPLYALLTDQQSARAAAAFERQQLGFDGTCAPVRSNLLKAGTTVRLCPLRRKAPEQPAIR
jgi:hypothetical protein